jgi:spermidine synthase
MAEDWFLEKHTPYAGLTLAVGERLLDLRSDFQRIEVLDTLEYGRMLLLDGCVMLTDRDEHVYHEMIVHPPLLLHPAPRRVLIVGGGDGGSVREVLRHAPVERVTLVEIDPAVIETARRFFPALATGLDDPRCEVVCCDGFDFLDGHPEGFDVILVDSIDPVGEAAKLFTSAFYGKVRASLRRGGIAVFQTESPFYNTEVLVEVSRKLRSLFAHVAPYLAHVPTSPSGLWSFTFASDAVDPLAARPREQASFLADLKYFHPALCRAAFVLPAYLQRRLAP